MSDKKRVFSSINFLLVIDEFTINFIKILISLLSKLTSFSILPNTTVSEFKMLIQEKYPQLSQINSYAIAVNENYANDQILLKNNDVVAIIPPVSGG